MADQELKALLNADELAAFNRCVDCFDDGEGYDVPKPMMSRLAQIGVLRHVGKGVYETTEFGMHILLADVAEPVSVPTAQAVEYFYSGEGLDKVGPFKDQHAAWMHFKGDMTNKVALRLQDDRDIKFYTAPYQPAVQNVQGGDERNAALEEAAASFNGFGRFQTTIQLRIRSLKSAAPSQPVAGKPIDAKIYPADRVMVDGEHLAKCVEGFLTYLNEKSNIEECVIEPDDSYGEHSHSIRYAIHEFRKRHKRYRDSITTANAGKEQ